MVGQSPRHGTRSGGSNKPKPYGRGTYRRQLAELLVATGYFPPHIEFDTRDLLTVISVMNERGRESGRK